MSESIAVGIFLMLLFGAATVYLYSRVTYTEKRLSMMESLLVDIKMMIESSDSDTPPLLPPPAQPSYQVTRMVLEEDESVYTAVLEQAVTDISGSLEVTGDVEVAPAAQSIKVGPNYDSMTRAELATLAEQRSLRVTKRAGRGEIINLLRKADSSNNGQAPTGENGSTRALFPTADPVGGDLSVDTGNAGAELEEANL